MAKIDNRKQAEIRQEKVIEQVSKTEEFFKYGNIIWGCLLAILIIGLGILAYAKFYLQPKKAEAMEQTYPAETSFRSGEYDLALNGDGNVLGFKDILDNYGTKGGKDIYFYAGVSELQLGNFDDAIKYLKKYKGKDHILSARALACIGDAYTGLEDYTTAVSYFEKAADLSDDMFSASYLLKAGITYEELGNNDKALACYKRIKDTWPQSVEGYDIDKYISRIEYK